MLIITRSENTVAVHGFSKTVLEELITINVESLRELNNVGSVTTTRLIGQQKQ